ncbi:MAG: hypothetical protein NT075_26450, partial [Chloroflexi bacterium]|nr:hypothetical protein [Chloroflexota bacterium]
MTNPNPPGDQITGSAGDNTRNMAVGKDITLNETAVTVSGDHNHIYVGSRKAELPLHYPPRAEHFVGRKEELDKLLADLHLGRVVTLCGPGGIGKTALAAEAIALLAPDPSKPPVRFPDGVFFHSFYNQKEALLALEQIAISFGEELRPTPALAAQRALAGKQALLLLDGTEDADDLPSVLAVRGNCGVLVTSRRHNDAVADFQDIRPLPPEAAIKLLQLWAGKYATESVTVRSICMLIGELPLAVRLVGRYLRQKALDANEYISWLEKTPLAALDQGQRREESVPILLARSLLSISEQARQVLAVV